MSLKLNDSQENPFDVRESPVLGVQHGSAVHTLREHIAALNNLPGQIEKLERKQRAAEQSAQKKQERIHELEAKVHNLEAQLTRYVISRAFGGASSA